MTDRARSPPFYPRYCFDAAPTFNKWSLLRAGDILGLRSLRGFEGQDYFFYKNIPIRWVRIVGIIVAIDDYNNNTRRVLTVDDSSGANVECMIEAKTTSRDAKNLNHVNPTFNGFHGPVPPEFGDFDIGHVVDVKGVLSAFRAGKQIKVHKARRVRSTAEEVDLWEKRIQFRRNVLDCRWVLSEEQVHKLKLGAEQPEGAELAILEGKRKLKAAALDTNERSDDPYRIQKISKTDQSRKEAKRRRKGEAAPKLREPRPAVAYTIATEGPPDEQIAEPAEDLYRIKPKSSKRVGSAREIGTAGRNGVNEKPSKDGADMVAVTEAVRERKQAGDYEGDTYRLRKGAPKSSIVGSHQTESEERDARCGRSKEVPTTPGPVIIVKDPYKISERAKSADPSITFSKSQSQSCGGKENLPALRQSSRRFADPKDAPGPAVETGKNLFSVTKKPSKPSENSSKGDCAHVQRSNSSHPADKRKQHAQRSPEPEESTVKPPLVETDPYKIAKVGKLPPSVLSPSSLELDVTARGAKGACSQVGAGTMSDQLQVINQASNTIADPYRIRKEVTRSDAPTTRKAAPTPHQGNSGNVRVKQRRAQGVASKLADMNSRLDMVEETSRRDGNRAPKASPGLASTCFDETTSQRAWDCYEAMSPAKLTATETQDPEPRPPPFDSDPYSISNRGSKQTAARPIKDVVAPGGATSDDPYKVGRRRLQTRDNTMVVGSQAQKLDQDPYTVTKMSHPAKFRGHQGTQHRSHSLRLSSTQAAPHPLPNFLGAAGQAKARDGPYSTLYQQFSMERGPKQGSARGGILERSQDPYDIRKNPRPVQLPDSQRTEPADDPFRVTKRPSQSSQPTKATR